MQRIVAFANTRTVMTLSSIFLTLCWFVGFALPLPQGSASDFGFFKAKYHSYQSPPYSSLKTHFEYQKEVLELTYLSKIEFLFEFSSLDWVSKDLALSTEQEKKFSVALEESKLIVAKANDAVREFNEKPVEYRFHASSKRELNDRLDGLREELDREYERGLTAQHRERVTQLLNRFDAKINGLEKVLLNLASRCNSSEEEVRDYARIESKIRGFCLTHRRQLPKNSGTKSKLTEGVLAYWVQDIVDEKLSEKLVDLYRELGHSYFPELILNELENVDSSPLKDLTTSLDFLWRIESKVNIFPNRTTERTVDELKKSGVLLFIRNLGYSPTYKRFFDMTHEQVRHAKSVYHDLKKAGEKPNEEVLADILLPVQMEMLDERIAWREVEVYGMGASMIHGRIGQQLGLTKEQKKQLIERSKEIKNLFQEHEAELDEMVYAQTREFLDKHGFENLFIEGFGPNPEPVSESD